MEISCFQLSLSFINKSVFINVFLLTTMFNILLYKRKCKIKTSKFKTKQSILFRVTIYVCYKFVDKCPNLLLQTKVHQAYFFLFSKLLSPPFYILRLSCFSIFELSMHSRILVIQNKPRTYDIDCFSYLYICVL